MILTATVEQYKHQIDATATQIAELEHQLIQLREKQAALETHLQALLTLDSAMESAKTQVTQAIAMASAIAPDQLDIFKAAISSLFASQEVYPLLSSVVDDDNDDSPPHYPQGNDGDGLHEIDESTTEPSSSMDSGSTAPAEESITEVQYTTMTKSELLSIARKLKLPGAFNGLQRKPKAEIIKALINVSIPT